MIVDISQARKIPGYMSDAELTWLAEQATTRHRVVEIGSFRGRSTRALGAHSPGLVWAVDTWIPSRYTQDVTMADFKQNMEGLENVYPMPCSSAHAAWAFGGREFDMIFIDASHDYESVKADILAWRPLLAPGGLLCGHDFDPYWPGVMKAVTELVPGYKVEAGSIWRAS